MEEAAAAAEPEAAAPVRLGGLHAAASSVGGRLLLPPCVQLGSAHNCPP